MRWGQLNAFITIAFVLGIGGVHPCVLDHNCHQHTDCPHRTRLDSWGYATPPTSNYVWALALLAIFGAVLPYLMRRYRTLTRVYLALAGVICLILMQLHLPAGYPEIHWGPGYYAAACAFFVAALISMYTLGRIQR